MKQLGFEYSSVVNIPIHLLIGENFSVTFRNSELEGLSAQVSCEIRDRKDRMLIRFDATSGLAFDVNTGSVSLSCTALETNKLIDHVGLQYDIRVEPQVGSPFYVMRGDVIAKKAITRSLAP